MKKVQVLVRLKPGVLDVQGKAVEHGIADMGFESISGVRVGKLIELEVSQDTEESRKQIDELCTKLLSNPIIEDYEIRES